MLGRLVHLSRGGFLGELARHTAHTAATEPAEMFLWKNAPMTPRPASSPLDHHVARLEEARDVPVLVRGVMTTSFGSTSNGLSPTAGGGSGAPLPPLAGGAAASALGMRGLTLTSTLHGTFIGLESLYRSVTSRPTMCEPKQKSLSSSAKMLVGSPNSRQGSYGAAPPAL